MKPSVLLLFILFTSLLLGCKEKSKYQKLVEKELSKNVRYDSLFLDYHFGMTRKEFYTYSWELNKQQKVRQGPSNQTVEYELKGLPHKAFMNYYPVFKDNKIVRMSAKVRYEAWAPWNKNLFADTLKYDLLKLFEQQYDNDFIEVEDPKKGTTFINVYGNRKISVFADDDYQVAVIFTDLTAEHSNTDSKN